jgi:hypothetical protein
VVNEGVVVAIHFFHIVTEVVHGSDLDAEFDPVVVDRDDISGVCGEAFAPGIEFFQATIEILQKFNLGFDEIERIRWISHGGASM